MRASLFQEELSLYRSGLDISADFSHFHNDVYPLVQSLPMLLHNLPRVVDVLLRHLSDRESFCVPSLLHFVGVLSQCVPRVAGAAAAALGGAALLTLARRPSVALLLLRAGTCRRS